MRSTLRHSALVAAAVAPLLAQACSSARTPTPAVRADVGVFRITLSPDSAKLTVAGPDGSALLEGVDASSDVGTPTSDNDDAPPMTGFAVREVATTYQMQFGSFKITEVPAADWRVARSAQWAGDGAPVTLLDGSGRSLANLAFAASSDPNHLVVDVTPADGPERRFSWGFRCGKDDHFLGFGEQTWGADARGETIPVWVQEEGIHKDMSTDDPRGAWQLVGRRHNSYMPIPEFLSSRGFMAVADTVRLSTFSMCGERDDIARMQLELPVRLHLFYGPTPVDAITRKSAVFGRPKVPPAFAFAPWNDAIFGSANVRRVAKKLRDNGVPSSVLWTEDWRGGDFVTDATGVGRYALKEEWEVDRTLYPDFESVAKDLHDAGFKWLVYFNSFVEKDSNAWPETAPAGLLIKDDKGQPYVFTDAKFKEASLVDFTNPAAAAWAVSKLKAALALGADGWMGDYSEWMPTDAVLAQGSGLEGHNTYPVEWQKTQRAALDGMADGIERLNFVRSGWFGSPALVDAFWPGDQQTDWAADDGIKTVVPSAIGAGIAGMSTSGSDIAGYQNYNSPLSSKELFFRWTELGALSPVMRTHHGTLAKANWSFESDDESLQHWARYARLHVSLAPYLRTLAQVAHDTGVAITRPLAVMHPGEPSLWPVADEYFLGPRLLVAPVVDEGAVARDVVLPKGRWYPWLGGAAVAAADPATHVKVAAAMSEIPLFARAGAIVPTYPEGVETLTTEASSAKNASSVNAGRIVYAFAGDAGAFAETDGASFSLAATGDVATASGDGSATWSGAALSVCNALPAAPCLQRTADGVRAWVSGGGTLEVARGGVSVATLEVKTASTPSYQLVVRY